MRVILRFCLPKGQIVVMLAFMMVILLGVSALVVDLGLCYLEKARMQNVVDTAAFPAAFAMPDKIATEDVVFDVMEKNGYVLGEKGVQGIAVIPNPDGDHPGRVQVRLRKTVPAAFARVLGFPDNTLETRATAVYMAGRNVVPWMLFQDDVGQLVAPNVYELKQGPLGAEFGNFGALAMGGAGAKIYLDNILQGSYPLERGDEVPTQPGNLNGPTKKGVNTRIKNEALVVFCPVTLDPMPHGSDLLTVDHFAKFELQGVGGNGLDCFVQAKFLGYDEDSGGVLRPYLID